jgi:hypothetical protein
MKRSLIRRLTPFATALICLVPVTAVAEPVDSPTGIDGPTMLVPLPPPLFNDDGSPFIPGTPIVLPIREDGGQYKYEFDPSSNMYVPLMEGDALPQDPDPLSGLVPLPPPLFNDDGSPFIPGTPIVLPIREDGTQLEYKWDAISGLYIPVVNGKAITDSVVIAPFYDSDGSVILGNGPIAGSLISITSVDPLTGKEVSVVYPSNQPPAINPDGTTNDVAVIGYTPFDLTANPSETPLDQQVGTWAVVDKNGIVINTIDCSSSICGVGGKLGGKIDEPSWAKGGCPDGCQLVIQVPPNPITGQSMGGFATSSENMVSYNDGVFKVVTTDSGKEISRTIENGIITDATGERVSLNTGIQLPSVIKDPALKKQVDIDITAADITPIKTTKGYQLSTDDQLSAVDSTLKVIAVKKGAKKKAFSLAVDNQGELFIRTNSNLSGYKIKIKRGKELLKSISVK